ncbi:MAG: polyphosphate polymerase domain-containing protein [Actinobacteria bacterium]|nr:polyphosphate polymerase domain-containing protein [Actinomycetota bacterium]
MMTTLPVDRFAPITLPELLAGAELLTRFDRKYLLDRQQAEALLQEFDPHTRALTIDGRRRFRYESVYFDTPDLLSYRQAAHARRHRFKVRTRSYLDSGLAFLEVKVRGDREITVKDRIGHEFDTRDQLTDAGRDHVEDTLDRRGMDGSAAQQLRPTLITRYERTTLVPPEPGVRVTIDTGLTWQDVSPASTEKPGDGVHFLPNTASGRQIRQAERLCGRNCPDCAAVEPGTRTHAAGEHALALADLVIVETKSGARPSAVDRLLWRSGQRPASVSKYGTGLAALRGELPANKWARILRHHFHTTEELPCAA